VNCRLLVAVALFAASLGLNLYRLGGRFSNGDEVIYAEAAREMATSGDWLTMRWQGKEQLERPPTSIWPLALAYKAFGPSEIALRGVCAFEAALVVALLFVMACWEKARERPGWIYGWAFCLAGA